MECCRLREKGDKSYVTYKIDHYDNGIWIFSDEFETEVKDITVMEKIFQCLGLKRLVFVDNVKHLYETPDYEIALEEVADLGCFLEVEALHDDESLSAEEIKSKIYDFIENLGLVVGAELNSGKPELLLQKKIKLLFNLCEIKVCGIFSSCFCLIYGLYNLWITTFVIGGKYEKFCCWVRALFD